MVNTKVKWLYKGGGGTLKHRLIIEESIGRKLTKEEVIHHIDEDPTNNELSNLKLMTKKEHNLFHANKKKRRVKLICDKCKNPFEIKRSIFRYKVKKFQKLFFCSPQCIGNFKFPRKMVKYNKRKDLIRSELENGLSGYAISKKHNLNKQTVYNHIKSINR